eukprot:CAMPEP_0176020370 /NCGR_PEP_ID=MMETSP0120_2-20121206/9865_1 /TAXON_ID=160619 /ORGANISM="Kryptoperidinium foliaceum, Strain CCMP 1326" /LENGTH=183 /DNA_ID=CAMNT_0017353463 /DNA_START=475 /DNA_END=1024 /DNA_ORIENTATION=+
MTFGIPVDALPLDYNGRVKTKNHFRWIQQRQHLEQRNNSGQDQEEESSCFETVIEPPALTDVLLRRGKNFVKNPGNQRMQELVTQAQAEYVTSRGKPKWIFAASVVDEILSSGGRFLECSNNGVWSEVDRVEAIRRVSKGMKNEPKLAPVAAQQQERASGNCTGDSTDGPNVMMRKLLGVIGD